MTNVLEGINDLDTHTVDTDGYTLKGVAAKSKRGRAFLLAYTSWLEFTTNQATAPVCEGMKE